jgi:hypothetical protein
VQIEHALEVRVGIASREAVKQEGVVLVDLEVRR